MKSRVLFFSALMLAQAASAHAQLISVKTVPISQADQFVFLPSRYAGMGGVSIALPDALFDLGVNPSKGARLAEARFFSAPSLYTVTHDAGAGRSLPVGTAGKSGSWFAGVAATFQQIDRSEAQNNPVPLFLTPQGTTSIPTDDGSRGNQFVFGALGRSLGQHGLSVGASVFWAEIHSMDGVDRLYAGSQSVRQAGHATDVRAGLLKEWTGGSALDALVLHNRLDMTHDVTFLDFIWDPATLTTFQQPREQRNADITDVWGLHLGYQRPTGTPGVRVGGILTANRMSHPKLPEYQFVQVQRIPWDPGHTNAFNLGLGISKVDGPATFGVDFILEPVWTHTWADAQADVATRTGGVILAGGKTVENYFHFTNATFRIGVDRGFGSVLNVQLGLAVHPVNYRFWQVDHVQEAGRSQDISWVETLPTWGIHLRYPEFELSYQGSVTGGTGRPGVTATSGCSRCVFDSALMAGNDILSAPSTASTQLGGVSLFTHRISIAVPLGRGRASNVQGRP